MFTETTNVSILDEYISREVRELTKSNYMLAAVNLAAARGRITAADIEAAYNTIKSIALDN